MKEESAIFPMRSRNRNQTKTEIESFYANKIVNAFAPDAIPLSAGAADFRQPDVLYMLDSQLIGIEITGAYYCNQHAKIIKDGSRPTARDQAIVYKFSVWEPDNLIRESVEKRIMQKARKLYSNVDQVWLGIHQEAELSDKGSTDLAIKEIVLPGRHPFSRIFLMHRLPWNDGGGYRVVQIFPTVKDRWLKPSSEIVEAIFNLKPGNEG